ncbi:hypothetical protein EJ04DRAFT_507414 [Polyplosphaeria fusca]|uniref:Uncharacterized protein n=1 Tax=Polyplosphaeria fusca TaxID=682080 RepID=A0A9P4RA70_9PLEO|nr:hypothetical protein EJ04DRAFT_507414 [Polyplosphaeria fusca]
MEYFYALLTRSGVFDLWIYAIWAMRAALEEELTDDGPNDAHEPGTKVQKYDGLVPGAAMWVLGLGEELYEKEEDLTPSAPNQGKPGRPGKLWTDGKAEFSEARWKFWKKRFGEVMEIEGTRKETVDIAKQAYELMQKIDGEGA